MRRRLIMLTIGGVGLLVVFVLLAFAYVPHISATAAPAASISQPASIDANAASRELKVDNIASDATNSDAVDVAPQQQGHHCDADIAASTGY